jgi:class 3 adenylate cyclase
LRRLAAESGGRIIDWAGDGCFLVFETPSAAVLFALRLQQAHGEEPGLPGVRTGIHMGEVSERPGPDGDVAHPRVEGLAVDLAARISGLARPAQVLRSSSVAIAVLPFVNMSSDKENEYFSDGITEDLITALSKVSALRVAARTSSFAFKGRNEDVRSIGTQLNVVAVLEGSVGEGRQQGAHQRAAGRHGQRLPSVVG